MTNAITLTDIPETLFEKVIGRKRPIGWTIIIAFILIGVPFLVGSIWYGVREIFEDGYWRGLLTGPIIIIYILVVTPKLVQMEKKVSKEFLPIIRLSDEEISALLQKTGKLETRTELSAIVLGALFGAMLVILQCTIPFSTIKAKSG